MAKRARRAASPRASVVTLCAAAFALVSMAGCAGSDESTDSHMGGDDAGPRFGPFPDVEVSQVKITDHTVESFDGTGLAVTTIVPPHATAESPVPVILHSPGLGGARWSGIAEEGGEGWPDLYVKSGFVLVSQQHRGAGESEGTFTMHLPAVHGRDTVVVMDWLAEKPYVARDDPGDPVIGMIGASSGGMAQLVAALYEVKETGETRIDSLAPHSAPFSINDTLAPNDVPRSLWWDMIMGSSLSDPDLRMDPEMMQIGAHVIATSSYPDGTAGQPDGKEYLWQRSSKRLVLEHGPLDVPALVSRSMRDSAVPFSHAVDEYMTGLTAGAFNQSLLVADYRGVHTTPLPRPPSVANRCEDTWGGSIESLTLQFHRIHLLGEPLDLGPSIQLSTRSECLMLDALPPARWTDVDGTMVATAPALTVQNPEPALLPVTAGPIRFAGTPQLNATITFAPPDARIFFGLAAGPAPEEAQLLADQWMPMQVAGSGTVEAFDLAGMAATVEDDETLYLVVGRWVDQFAHDHDRRAAPVVLEGIELALPVVPSEGTEANAAEQTAPAERPPAVR